MSFQDNFYPFLNGDKNECNSKLHIDKLILMKIQSY